MSEGTKPRLSPLSRTVESGGQKLRLDIYESGDGGWVLEAVDDHNNTTLWQKTFNSDEDALREGMEVIEREGVAGLTAPPSS